MASYIITMLRERIETCTVPLSVRKSTVAGRGAVFLEGSGLERKIAKGGRPTKRLLVRYPRAAPIVIFLITMTVVLVSVVAIERGMAARQSAQQQKTTELIASALERRAATSSALLRAGAALIATQGEVPEVEFRSYVEELTGAGGYGGADGIGWARWLPRAELTQFELSTAAELGRPYQVTPQPKSSARFLVPVTYLEPDTDRNRHALGYDMYSDPVRLAAIDAAVQSRQATASGPLILRRDGAQPEPGFAIFMPVFHGEDQGGGLKGFTYSPFDAGDFVLSALELEGAGGYGVNLYDPAQQNLRVASIAAPDGSKGHSTEQQVMIANRPWMLEIVAPEAPNLSVRSLMVLQFGLLVALLLSFLARLLTQQAIEDEAALHWYAEQSSIRNSLTRELNHRVKNTLANVLSIIALTRRRSESLDGFAESLTGRIRALSATHDLLTKSDWSTTPIRDVIDAELAPYALDENGRALELEGPDVDLAPNDALSLGLAIHELATNAAKYGALSVPEGKIEVRWSLREDTLVELIWQEHDGPKVEHEGKRGFGLDLIERIVANELGNPVDLKFDPQGVRCVLVIPVRKPSEFVPRAAQT